MLSIRVLMEMVYLELVIHYTEFVCCLSARKYQKGKEKKKKSSGLSGDNYEFETVLLDSSD